MYMFQDYELTFDYKHVDSEKPSARCVARHGQTVVIVIASIGEVEVSDCVPLTVNYSERFYSVNRIPPGFQKREPRSRDAEILAARLIDRSIRPTIDEFFNRSILINCTVVSYNRACSPEALSISAASSILNYMGVPCELVSGVALNLKSNTWLNGPGTTSLVVAGNYYGLSTLELTSSQLSPAEIIQGVQMASAQIGPNIDFIRTKLKKCRSLIAPAPMEYKNPIIDPESVIKGYFNSDQNILEAEKAKYLTPWNNRDAGLLHWKQIVRSVLRTRLLSGLRRIDGRDFESPRPMHATRDLLSVPHCYVTRGNTEVLCVVTESNNQNDSQLYELLEQNEVRKFFVHYNYLAGQNMGISRREIGHANLIRNALKCFVSGDRAIRLVSEVFQSDGSSSMSSVYAGSVALGNAGLEMPVVAGTSIGCLTQNSSYRFLTDLTATEDFLSDMDLKIAGTKEGITAVQVDLKVRNLPWYILEHAIHYGYASLAQIIGSTVKHSPGRHEYSATKHENGTGKNDHSSARHEHSANKQEREHRPRNESLKIATDDVQPAQTPVKDDHKPRSISFKLSGEEAEAAAKVEGISMYNDVLTTTWDKVDSTMGSILGCQTTCIKVLKTTTDGIEVQFVGDGVRSKIQLDTKKELVPGTYLALSKTKLKKWKIRSVLNRAKR